MNTPQPSVTFIAGPPTLEVTVFAGDPFYFQEHLREIRRDQLRALGYFEIDDVVDNTAGQGELGLLGLPDAE